MHRCIRVSQFGGACVLQPATVDSGSLRPGVGQVLIEAAAAGVNPVDTYIRSGLYAALPRLPYTPGSDCAGRVAAVGSGVSDLRPGDRVYTAATVSGAYSQLVLANRDSVFRLPESLDFSAGAALGVPAFTAMRALFTRGAAAAGEVALVHGASGGVGLVCCQLAASRGLRVLATAGSEAGRRLAAKCGASEVFDHSDPDYRRRIAEAAGPDGVQLIVEMLADVNLAADCQLAGDAGRIVVVGSRGSLDFSPRLTMPRELTILGCAMRRTTAAEMRQYADTLLPLLLDGTVRPIVGKEFPLEQAAAAHELIVGGAPAEGKIVLTVPPLSSG